MKNYGIIKFALTFMFIGISIHLNAQNSLCFSNIAQYHNPGYPREITTGFFNNDTFPDLAVVNQYSNDISILLNDGTGKFPNRTNFPVGLQPISLATGFLNNDNAIDIAVVNASDSTVSVLINDGNGQFTTSGTYNVGYLPVDVVITDLNNDSFPDIAVVNNDWSWISHFILNQGDGTFSGTNYLYSTRTYPTSIAAADFNHDGNIDLATACGADHKFVVAFNSGDSTFATVDEYLVGGNPQSIYAEDFNRDGYMDIVYADNNYNYAGVELNDGTGHFTSNMNLQYYGGGALWSLNINDFNNDGNMDIASANNFGNNLSLFLLDSAVHAIDYGQTYSIGGGTGVYSVTSADYDGDGMIDLATTRSDSNFVTVLLSTAPPFLSGIIGSPEVCQNDTVMLIVSGNAYSYSWTTGSQNDTMYFVGTYGGPNFVLGYDSVGCQSNKIDFFMVLHPLPNITATVSDSSVCMGSTDTLTVSGASVYSWTYSAGTYNGDTLLTTINVSDTFIVMGIDSNMCRNYDTVFVEAIDCNAGLANHSDKQQYINIYPNPTTEAVFIETETLESNDKVEIYDATGTLVLKQNIYSTKSKISLREFAAGIYLVKCRSQVFRIIKE